MTNQDNNSRKVMQDAKKQLALAQSRSQIMEASNRWWGRMVGVGCDDKTLNAWDEAVQERIRQLKEFSGERFAIPKVEEGYYIGPTPPIGWRVQWFQCNDLSIVYAADVVAQEAPGKLQLKLIKPKNSAHIAGDYALGCLHVSDPMHEHRHNVHTQTGGSWDYLPGQSCPDGHYALARGEVARRKAHKQKETEQRRLRDAAVQEQERSAKAIV